MTWRMTWRAPVHYEYAVDDVADDVASAGTLWPHLVARPSVTVVMIVVSAATFFFSSKQGLTLVPNSAQLELICPPHNST